MKTRTLAAMAAIAILAPALARAALVSGLVTDSELKPITGIRVELWAEDPVSGDVLLGRTYTDCQGGSCGFYAFPLAPPLPNDVYVLVKWEFELAPAAFYDHKVVRLVDERPTRDTHPTTSFAEVRCGTLPAAGCTREERGPDDVVFLVRMAQTQPVGLETLVDRIRQTLETVRLLNDGAVAWHPSYDVPVHVLTAGEATSSDGEIFVPASSFNGQGKDRDTVFIFHEMAHVIHYHHNGDSLPMTCFGPHDVHKENLAGCALKEGYASYLALLTAERLGIDDPYWRLFRDAGNGRHFQFDFEPAANTLWRGDEEVNGQLRPTGRQGTRFENGDRVEGAFSGFLFGVHDALGFAANFAAMIDRRPDDPREFLAGLVAAAGPGTPETRQIYEILQTHGILFNRARFQSEPFDDVEVPDEAPPAAGNHRQIDGFTFLRGEIATRFEAVGHQDLGLRPEIPLVDHLRIEVGIKPAFPSLLGAPREFTDFTPPAGFELGEVDVDTTLFPDGDHDLLIVGENVDGFTDNFLPTWVGDANPAADTDEKYLKLLGAWFDADRDPSTDPVTGGMVIFDNTPPTVSNFQPQ